MNTTSRPPRAARAPTAALAAMVMTTMTLSGCATGPQLGRPDTATAAQKVFGAAAGPARTQPLAPYLFAVGDEFDLRVPDAPQFDQTLKVRPDGKVSLALIGTLHALGRTPEDVEAELRERLHQRGGLPGGRDYLLQPNDEIAIKFAWQPQLNEQLRIRPDGKIQLPIAGTVEAQGLSPEELQQVLRQRYARTLRNPELAVVVLAVTTQNVRVATTSGPGIGRAGLASLEPTLIVRSYTAPQVFIGGEVGRPGVLVYRPGLTLLQALFEAGGTLATADAAHIVVLRRPPAGAAGTDGDAVQVLKLDIPADFARQPDRDVALQPFDVVVLPKSDIALLGDRLNQYLFNILPPLHNSSFGFVYNLNPNNNTSTPTKTTN